MTPRISPAEAHAKMKDEGFVYIDVRSPDDFAIGHPAGAVNVPLNDDFVDNVRALYKQDTPLIVGCKMGIMSLRAAKALEEAGFERVLEQRAGWDGARGTFGELLEPGWWRAGLPRE